MPSEGSCSKHQQKMFVCSKRKAVVSRGADGRASAVCVVVLLEVKVGRWFTQSPHLVDEDSLGEGEPFA